jgi:hypothetical protein
MHPDAIAAIREVERNDLSTLRGVIDAAKTCLRRDDDGEWRLFGSRGFIATTGGNFTVTVTGGRWRAVKRSLVGLCSAVQDYPAEDTLRLDHLPINDDEAACLRHAIGLRSTRPAATADHLHRQRGAV